MVITLYSHIAGIKITKGGENLFPGYVVLKLAGEAITMGPISIIFGYQRFDEIVMNEADIENLKAVCAFINTVTRYDQTHT